MSDSPKPIANMNRGRLAIWSIGLAVILFISVIIIARGALVGARLDLTEDKLFTLSPGTHKVLAGIDEPITLRLYFSSALGKELPGLAKYAGRVRDMIGEYVANSGGKIRLVEIDPVAFSDAEDEAVEFGLQGLPLDRTGEKVYFGLAGTNSTSEEEIIPFFSPSREPYLEYDLTKVVYRLANPDRKVIGLMSWLPVRGFPGSMMARMSNMGRPWQLVSHLEQLFAVEDVPIDTDEIPKKVDILFVLHPAELSDKTAYAIDQFMMRGGRALIFVDPLAEIAQRLPGTGGKFVDTASDLGPIFKAWGLEYDKTKAVGDMLAAQRVNAGSQANPQPLEYPAWLQLKKSNLVSDDIITTEIDTMVMASAGALSFKAGSGLDFKPIVSVSEQSMLLDAEDLKGRPDFINIHKNFKASGKRYALVARVSGETASAFPEGPPPASAYVKDDKDKKDNKAAASDDKEKDEAKEPTPEEKKKAAERREDLAKTHLAKSSGPIHAVVFTDADMLRDAFWVQVQNLLGQSITIPVSDNMNLVTNALDNLTGSDELIGLRSRGVSTRPFTLVEELTRQAELRLRAKERELQERQEETERKLRQLQSPARGEGDRAILSPEQIKEINKFKGELLTIRKQLRDVQLGLRKDIEELEGELWVYNIGLIPVLVALAAVILGLARTRRRRQRMETEARG
ncbi:MAG TPA: Gldg family protein [Alphaproteobacteria bacterium]|nr:Gldg family protein [Alphaproteobacteria bacterium]